LHVTLLVLLPAFAWLTRWQLDRALGGNTLSWAYTVLWPFFGIYAIYMWWQLIHDQRTVLPRQGARTVATEGPPPADHKQPGWALTGGRRKNMAIAAALPIDEEAGGRGERFASQTPEEAAELAEYNRYLEELNAADSDPARP
jgi:hypothetical protein